MDTGNLKTIQWLLDHASYPHENYCLIWPFATARGYGHFKYMKRRCYAHTYMCQLVNGPRPTPEHQPAHSCGMGDEGCTNPRHLSWKTPAENQLDKRLHGTSMPLGRKRFKLSIEHVDQIRALEGQKTQDELARMFGVSRRNIGAILGGRSWGATFKIDFWTPEEDETIRQAFANGKTFREAAALVNRPVHATQGRAYRIGLRSGVSPTGKKHRA